MPYKDPEMFKKYNVERALKMRDFLREYKVSAGCMDCGYSAHHAGLEFDHREDKFQNLAAMIRYSKEKVLTEIAKCDVVCGTCHNIRTFNRKHGE